MTAPVAKPPTKSPYSYTAPPDTSTPKIVKWVRIGLTLVTIPIGVSAFRDEYAQVPLLSGIDLAVHEFGHMLFMPFGTPLFGDTMVILGGSFFQILVPTVFASYFLFGKQRHRDLHAAMLCQWWVAMNVLSVAVYMADARKLQLMLISGSIGEDNPDGHDWRNLFLQWGMLSRDTVIAGRMRVLAGLLFFVSVFVGVYAAIFPKHKAETEAAG